MYKTIYVDGIVNDAHTAQPPQVPVRVLCCDLCEAHDVPLYNIDGDILCEECAAENISYRELLEDRYGTVCE